MEWLLRMRIAAVSAEGEQQQRLKCAVQRGVWRCTRRRKGGVMVRAGRCAVAQVVGEVEGYGEVRQGRRQ